MNEYDRYIMQYVIVIFTHDGHEISESPKLSLGQLLKNLNINRDLIVITSDMVFKTAKECDTQSVIIILHPETKPSQDLETLVDQLRRSGKYILAAIHQNIQDEEVINAINNTVKRSTEDWSQKYSHELSEEYVEWFSFANLCLSIEHVQPRNFKKHYVKLVQSIRNPLQPFSILKHRIAHLFMSTDIDFQGIGEVNKNDRNNTLKYLTEVLKSKKSNYYAEKLIALQTYVINERDGDSISKLIRGRVEEGDEHWLALRVLSGLHDNGKPIVEFMSELDQLLKNPNEASKELSNILGFFDNKKWQVESAKPQLIGSFHDWFCALIDILENIQEKLQPKQQPKSQEA